MKVLLLDKNLVDPLHRAKWRHLAARAGIDLAAVAPERWVENYRVIPCRPEPGDGFPITTLPVAWPGRENRGFFRRGLAALVRRHRPDVIVAMEEPFGLFAAQATLAARGLAARRVFYTWDNVTGGRSYPFRPSFFYRAVEGAVGRRADRIWCANREAHDRFARDYPGKARLLYFGLDLSGFPGRAAEPRGERFAVGYVGRLLPAKGIDILIEALARLPETAALTLVGRGPERGALAALAARRGVAARVDFRDAVPSERVAEELGRFHALVLPSRTTRGWKEQFGRVIVEAMSVGVPVIGSSSGAIPEVIGDAGLVFPEGDAGELAARLRRLAGDPGERAALAARGHARAQEFGAERFAANAARLLEELVGA
jgi:glycosyltransferase involved in cell wall biosynthesis